jgi:hypothetical protein
MTCLLPVPPGPGIRIKLATVIMIQFLGLDLLMERNLKFNSLDYTMQKLQHKHLALAYQALHLVFFFIVELHVLLLCSRLREEIISRVFSSWNMP